MPDEHQHISSQDARGGEIILKSRAQRAIFLAGLIGMVILAVVLAVSSYR